MSLITTYLKLTKEYSEKYGDKTVILMMVGSFYEIYGEKNSNSNSDGSFSITGSKIEEISKICDLTIAQKTVQYVMAGFTYTKIDKYLKKLQDVGYTAVVITQDPNNPSNRNVEGIYSPGTFFNPESLEISNNSMCIWIEQVSYMKNKSVVVGIANIDIYTGRVTIFEYTTEDKHNPTTYDELERYISTYKPSEIVMITNFTEKILDDIMNYTGILCKNVHKVILSGCGIEGASSSLSSSSSSSSYLIGNARKCEKQTYQKEILNKFYKFNIIASFIEYVTIHEYATQAFIFLLQFLYEHNPNLVNKIREPIFDNKSDRVILANHSLKQLNIIDDDSYNGKYSSVSKFLNNCITPMGSRKFKNKILNPIFDSTKLNKDYDITEYIINKRGDTLITEWRTNMGELKDIEKLHRQIIHNKVTPRSLFHLYNNLTTISSMYEKMKSDTTIMAYILSELENKKDSYDLKGKPVLDISELCKKLQSYIETHLVLEKCFNIDNLNFEENFICPLISETLDNIVYDYENSYIELQTIQGYFCDLVSSCEKASKTEKRQEFVKIHDTEKMGYSLITTKRRAKLLEEQLKKQIKSSNTNSTNSTKTEVSVQYETYKKVSSIICVELSGITYPVATGSNSSIQSTQIDKICSTIIKSKQKMRTVIENIFTEFIKNIQNIFETDIQMIVDMVTMIDVVQNQVYVALKHKYCKPVIKKQANANEGDDSFVKARDLRHCLIEHINTNELYVTNDIELGNSTEQSGILLYGTNAVGKTSLIRAIGIAIIMAQAGLYVPCSSFEYIPYKSIFTRILGNDNLFKGLSTFMVEMSELRVILKSANNFGLILGDELCSGTEMDSAISIFVAGLKKLHDAKCSFIFATHMHEINKYEEIEAMDRLAMKHLEVTYNKEKDVLVYDRKLKDGPGFSMYGLEVCRSLHLPEDFLKYANEIRLKYRNNDQSILSAKVSKYNAKKIRNMCEMCDNEMGTEIHHLQHQKNADQRNFIGHFHKNHVANLVSICEKCHDMIHSNEEQHRKVMTSSGPIIIKM